MGIKVKAFKESVRSGREQYPDERLVLDYRNLILSYNAEAAGLSRFGLAGYTAFFRPHLAELLLIEPVKLLFICGLDTLDAMLRHIEFKLGEEGKTLWQDAGPEGRRWLHDNLHRKRMFMETLILNFKELTDDVE